MFFDYLNALQKRFSFYRNKKLFAKNENRKN